MQRWSLVAVAVVAVLSASCGPGCGRPKINDDEPPIIVRNGSMEIETPVGKWIEGEDEDEGTKQKHWSQDTKNGNTGQDVFYVKVLYKSATGKPACEESDQKVEVYHSDGVTAVFKRKDDTAKVKKHQDFNLKSDEVLLHESAGSYITEVRVGSKSCAVGKDELDKVCIAGREPIACQ